MILLATDGGKGMFEYFYDFVYVSNLVHSEEPDSSDEESGSESGNASISAGSEGGGSSR